MHSYTRAVKPKKVVGQGALYWPWALATSPRTFTDSYALLACKGPKNGISQSMSRGRSLGHGAQFRSMLTR
jgi:hypothetical protein